MLHGRFSGRGQGAAWIAAGFSHGMLTTNADVINADILAFMQFEFRRIGVANSSAETYGG